MQQLRYFMLAFGLSLLLMAGCSVEQAPKLTDAKQAVCQSLSSLRGTAAGLATISPDTSVAEVRALKGKLDTLVEAARTANTVLQSQPITDMINAYADFGSKVAELNPDQRVGDAATALQSSSARITTALDRASASLACAQ